MASTLVLKQQYIGIKSIRYDSGKKLACWPCETMKFSNVGEMRLNLYLFSAMVYHLDINTNFTTFCDKVC